MRLKDEPRVEPVRKSKLVERIPVTLLTGFLGSGKTTILNYLLRQPGMAGTAVLINEFGEIGIDHHLVEQVDENTMILDSGCLCCSVREDLVKALKDLALRSAKREIPPVSRVLIETTGLADPAPVISTLTQERFVSARYVFDGLITAVDATHASRQMDARQEAMRQIAMADRLLITKCDLADAAMLAQLDARLTTLNPGARRTEVRQGRVEPSALFGCGIYSTTGKLPDVAGWLGEEKIRATDVPMEPVAPVVWRKGITPPPQIHGRPESRHDDSISSFVVTFDEPVPWYGFTVAIGQILQNLGPKILRLKGLLSVVGDSRPWVVHCVQESAYPPVPLPKWPGQSAFEDRRGRLVFIACELTEVEKATILESLSTLPRNIAGARSGAARIQLPTRCWLEHASLPSASSAAIQHEGWVVQTRRLART